MSHVCDTPECVDRRQALVHLYIEIQPVCPMCVTAESVDRKQDLVHLYIESRSGCPTCVTHLNM